MDIHQCSVRFNDNNINQHKAWIYLKNRNKKEYPSYAALIADAVVYFIEKDNADLQKEAAIQENKLIDQICKAVQKCIADALSSEILKQIFNSDKKSENDVKSESSVSDVDWAYLCGSDD